MLVFRSNELRSKEIKNLEQKENAMANFDYIGPRGGNWAYWVKAAKVIGEFVKANKLAPVTITVAGQVAAPKRMIDLGIRGGIKVSHVHFNDNIYLLNDEQWAKFSGNLIADASAKLAKVKKIGFDQALVLGTVTQEMSAR